MRHLIDWFKEVAGLWMVIGMISIAALLFSAAKQFGFTANSKIAGANEELKDLSYKKYDGINLLGSEVINAIRRYQEEIKVTVYTGESVDTYHGNFKLMNNNRKSERYIKPSQSYTGSLLKTENKEVVGLVFAKEGIVLTEKGYKELLSQIVGMNPEDTTMDRVIHEVTNLVKGKDQTIILLQQETEKLTGEKQQINGKLQNAEAENRQINNQLQNVIAQKQQINSQLLEANTKYGELNQHLIWGKGLIADAISKKGVSTTGNENFNVMASNILKIQSANGKRIVEEKLLEDRSIVIEHWGLQNGGKLDETGYYLDCRLNTKNDPSQVYLSTGKKCTSAGIYPTNYSNCSYLYKGRDGYCYARIYADYYTESWGERTVSISGERYRNVYYLSE
ncbi:MAG: hypothetical protein RSB37_01000 [Acetivibrio sp.]